MKQTPTKAGSTEGNKKEAKFGSNLEQNINIKNIQQSKLFQKFKETAETNSSTKTLTGKQPATKSQKQGSESSNSMQANKNMKYDNDYTPYDINAIPERVDISDEFDEPEYQKKDKQSEIIYSKTTKNPSALEKADNSKKSPVKRYVQQEEEQYSDDEDNNQRRQDDDEEEEVPYYKKAHSGHQDRSSFDSKAGNSNQDLHLMRQDSMVSQAESDINLNLKATSNYFPYYQQQQVYGLPPGFMPYGYFPPPFQTQGSFESNLQSSFTQFIDPTKGQAEAGDAFLMKTKFNELSLALERERENSKVLAFFRIISQMNSAEIREEMPRIHEPIGEISKEF